MTAITRYLGGAVLGMAMSCSSLAAETDVSEAGLYVVLAHVALKNFDDQYNNALGKDYVDGAAILLEWKSMEPRPGVYDWTNFDRWALKVVKLHKKLSIGVIAGWFTPDWLYDSEFGVPKNSFDYNRNPRAVSCAVLTQPSFWSPVYLREYGKMLAAMSQHLKELQVPDAPAGAAYSAISVVKVSGINRTTEETQVDATKPDDGPCHQSDAANIWAKAGFTPDKAHAAWIALAAETSKAFPEKILSMEIIHRDAFPAINNDGQIYTPARPVPDELTVRIIDSAVKVYGRRIMVQWDALSQGMLPQEVLEGGRKGSRIGWQMNAFLGFSAGCIYPSFKIEPCRTIDDFHSILDNGIKSGARYIEIQAPDADERYGVAFQRAHDKLQSRVLSSP